MSKSTAKLSVAKSASTSANPVANAMQAVLRDTYAVYLLTHNYHWNVEGPKFVSLHTLFEQQYTELFAAIDIMAERIRALNAYALPDQYDEILQSLKKLSNPMHKAGDADTAATKMVSNLVTLNEQLVASAQKAKRVAEKAGDDESVDVMVERISVHQKTLWMLRSIIK